MGLTPRRQRFVTEYLVDLNASQAVAFEVLVLGELQKVSLTRRGMAAFQKKLKQKAPDLVKHLKFRLVVG